MFYEEKKNKTVQCGMCPRLCVIKDGEFGSCNARRNRNGKLYAISYAMIVSSVAVDPIEKKPFYHFLPGSQALSFGTAGCNLHCLFCQNWQISQTSPEEAMSQKYEPEQLIDIAKSQGCESIAYTYTEPAVFYEFMLDTAKLARKAGIRNVAVSNGFVNQEPLKKIVKYIDAYNIDLKGDDKFYRRMTGGWLKPVQDTMKTIVKSRKWLEITNLVIPGYNDDAEGMRDRCKWIVDNLGDEVPLHITAFYPCYKLLHVKPTLPATLLKLRKIALGQGLKYVYTGNVPDIETNSTICPKCSEMAVRREGGFRLTEERLKDGACKCGFKIAGIWK